MTPSFYAVATLNQACAFASAGIAIRERDLDRTLSWTERRWLVVAMFGEMRKDLDLAEINGVTADVIDQLQRKGADGRKLQQMRG